MLQKGPTFKKNETIKKRELKNNLAPFVFSWNKAKEEKGNKRKSRRKNTDVSESNPIKNENSESTIERIEELTEELGKEVLNSQINKCSCVSVVDFRVDDKESSLISPLVTIDNILHQGSVINEVSQGSIVNEVQGIDLINEIKFETVFNDEFNQLANKSNTQLNEQLKIENELLKIENAELKMHVEFWKNKFIEVSHDDRSKIFMTTQTTTEITKKIISPSVSTATSPFKPWSPSLHAFLNTATISPVKINPCLSMVSPPTSPIKQDIFLNLTSPSTSPVTSPVKVNPSLPLVPSATSPTKQNTFLISSLHSSSLSTSPFKRNIARRLFLDPSLNQDNESSAPACKKS